MNLDRFFRHYHSIIFDFKFQAVGEIEQVYFENSSRHTMSSTTYNIHLYPSVYLKNFLPMDIAVTLPGITEDKLIEASKTLQIPTIEPGRSSIVIKVIRIRSTSIITSFYPPAIFIQFIFSPYNSCRSIWRRTGHAESKSKQTQTSLQYVHSNRLTVCKKSAWIWVCTRLRSTALSSWHYTVLSGC